MKTLQGKKAIVTGGAMGIGLCTCRRLVKEGVEVTIWDLNEEAMADAKKELAGMGGTVHTYKCDVSDKKRVNELVAQAKKDMGKIDILINNAGYVRAANFLDLPVENTIRQMEVNFNGPCYTMHAVLPDMVARNSGHIINLSSAGAFYSGAAFAAYGASKAAIWSMTDNLRIELRSLKKKGIKFSSVHPMNILTGMFEGTKFNLIGELLMPPLKNHDIIAEAIVNDGLKKGKPIIVRPKRAFLGVMIRGWMPDYIWQTFLLLSGAGTGGKNFVGRKGLAHTDPNVEKKNQS